MEWFARQAANRIGAIVLAVDYRLAPEHRFPTAVHDAIDALRWAACHAPSLGASRRKLAVMGDSAGGLLAAVAALSASRSLLRGTRGGERLRLPMGARLRTQLLLDPVIAPYCPTASSVRTVYGAIVGDGLCTWMWNAFLSDPVRQMADPRASPLVDLAVAWRRVPSAIVVTAQFDPLADEGEAYARHLLQHGVVVHAARRLEAHTMFAPETTEWAFHAARRLLHGEDVPPPPESAPR